MDTSSRGSELTEASPLPPLRASPSSSSWPRGTLEEEAGGAAAKAAGGDAGVGSGFGGCAGVGGGSAAAGGGGAGVGGGNAAAVGGSAAAGGAAAVGDGGAAAVGDGGAAAVGDGGIGPQQSAEQVAAQSCGGGKMRLFVRLGTTSRTTEPQQGSLHKTAVPERGAVCGWSCLVGSAGCGARGGSRGGWEARALAPLPPGAMPVVPTLKVLGPTRTARRKPSSDMLLSPYMPRRVTAIVCRSAAKVASPVSLPMLVASPK